MKRIDKEDVLCLVLRISFALFGVGVCYLLSIVFPVNFIYCLVGLLIGILIKRMKNAER